MEASWSAMEKRLNNSEVIDKTTIELLKLAYHAGFLTGMISSGEAIVDNALQMNLGRQITMSEINKAINKNI